MHSEGTRSRNNPPSSCPAQSDNRVAKPHSGRNVIAGHRSSALRPARPGFCSSLVGIFSPDLTVCQGEMCRSFRQLCPLNATRICGKGHSWSRGTVRASLLSGRGPDVCTRTASKLPAFLRTANRPTTLRPARIRRILEVRAESRERRRLAGVVHRLRQGASGSTAQLALAEEWRSSQPSHVQDSLPVRRDPDIDPAAMIKCGPL